MGDNNNMISSSLNASVFDINYDYSVNINGNSNTDNTHNHNHILPPSSSSDEISQFLRQILVRSASNSASFSPSSSIALTHQGSHADFLPSEAVFNREISAVDFPHSGACFSGNPPTAHVSSSSVGASGNETDEYECESEEGVEAVVDEATGKPAPSRSSSKRSRAAEVHNLSEKRRRSRINEKMKALQKLIPNSNKTDKASMLDEAIEYLKQLQLQVQMLTVRNGLNLHPMCLSGGSLRPVQTAMNVGDHTNISPHVSMTNVLHGDQHNQFANIPETRNPGSSSFGLNSSFRSQFEPFPILNSSETFKVTNQGNIPPHNQLGINGSKTNLPGFEAGDIQADSIPFDAQTPNLS